MKIEFVIAALVFALAGCTGTNRGNTTPTFSAGSSPAQLHTETVTNDSRATNSQDAIKPGDTFLITFINLSSGSTVPTFDLRVSDNGYITLIYGNVFHVAGKKTGELEKEIRDFYVPRWFGNLEVMVRLACQGSCVYADGGFRIPGRYPWTNGMRLKDAIDAAGGFAAAGGFTEFATHTIEVIHSDGTIDRFRLRGDWARTNNPALQDGDRIHNPRRLL